MPRLNQAAEATMIPARQASNGIVEFARAHSLCLAAGRHARIFEYLIECLAARQFVAKRLAGPLCYQGSTKLKS